MAIEKRVTQLVEEKIADRPDLFIVSIEMNSVNGVLTILIDGDTGVAIQDCVAISRHVGFYLEEENAIEEAYNLQVSSPGLDMPLKLVRQYHKNLNRSLTVKLKDGIIREGKLIEVNETGITIVENVKEKGKKATAIENVIQFAQIAETKVLISFK